ncbi:EthD family reductase [Glutamicibacter halophytocola]|uniref:EthD family reductase n=1 Tax=Glutamicibacter halophytocola TaxID=1933880 RepID=UPI0015C5769C|nr:EthD family reductase [Glutamicibacter halophytocola]NQD42248.1 EthD family reductase [Glutamicibacter halophytocola]
MIKIVAIVTAKEGLTREQFLHGWNVEHPDYVRKLPGLRRYRQNPAIEHKKQWPFSGMAELWFDSVRDVKLAYAGAEAEQLFDHEKGFLENVQWFIAEEREIPLDNQR